MFPFRPEVIEALERVTRWSTDWKPRYYLALGYWGTGRVGGADDLMKGLRNAPDYAPFYAARAALPGRSAAAQVADLRAAIALDAADWRYGKLLAERRLDAADTVGAAETATAYFARMPANYILGLTAVRTLVAAQRYTQADTILTSLKILPYEGAAEGHALYRETKLMLAVDALHAKQWDAARRLIAQAREWPERLGAGKPYDADLDERLEQRILADVEARAAAGATPPAGPPEQFSASAGLEARVIARWLKGAR